jgi:proteasome lid subunit RPN8/RPN11
MARQADLTADERRAALVRAASVDFHELKATLFCRYPAWEWATFARFGWRDTSSGLVVTLASLDAPRAGDLDEKVAHVAIQEPYSLRVALAADDHPLAIGVMHSHPHGSLTAPSTIDDRMDSYYACYFSDFAPGRPYVSLIFAEREGRLYGTGRVHWRETWQRVGRFLVDGVTVTVDGVRHVSS